VLLHATRCVEGERPTDLGPRAKRREKRERRKPDQSRVDPGRRVLIEQPYGSCRPSEPRIDWARVRALWDEEVEAAAASDSRAHARRGLLARGPRGPPGRGRKRQTGVRIDDDVPAWFRAQARGYQARMNAVLRPYVEARRREAK
jgi:uncharacterized protein (DUF4415 family)